MNNQKQVAQLIEQLKAQGSVMSDVAWQTARACIEWPYVYAARGAQCTPKNRQDCYNITTDEKYKEKTKGECQNFDNTGNCSGCQWFPDGQRVRMFDCRGFTYWVLKAVYGFELYGTGATTQWKTDSNWKAKGTIDTMPKDTLCCLFIHNPAKNNMSHTGFGVNDETVECSGHVYYDSQRDKRWTHWAVPACVTEGEMPVHKPVLKKGDKGDWVKQMQTELTQKGYNCGSIDGKFGNVTEATLKEFQSDYGLTATGVCNQATWDKLDSAATLLYKVTIPHVTKSKAKELVSQWPGAKMTKEKG